MYIYHEPLSIIMQHLLTVVLNNQVHNLYDYIPCSRALSILRYGLLNSIRDLKITTAALRVS